LFLNTHWDEVKYLTMSWNVYTTCGFVKTQLSTRQSNSFTDLFASRYTKRIFWFSSKFVHFKK